MSDELASMDATAQAQLVSRGELSARELVDAAIERIERLNPELNAVITPLFEKARVRADSGNFGNGPFAGVPFLMKDLDACTKDDPFHCGSIFIKDAGFCADHDSYLAEKFAAAGLISVGKSNTPEFGLTVTTEPDAYGPSRNPWNPDHSTGGSSGGSAAAVASGLVAAAHASDGGGSIRIPASECGLVGLKPSRGRVSLGPDYDEYWHGLVVSHVVTRSMRDSAAILDAVSEPSIGDPYTAPVTPRPYAEEVGRDPGRLRIGLVESMPAGVGEMHADCKAALEVTGRALEAAGHAVVYAHPLALDELPEFLGAFQVVVASWTAAAIDEWSGLIGHGPEPGQLEAGTRLLVETGRGVSAADYVAAAKAIGSFTRRMASWWDASAGDGFDILVTPTISIPPPKLGYLKASGADSAEVVDRVMQMIPFTVPFNLTGQPAMSLPLHWNDDGLPIGVQLAAAYGREDVLIRLGSQLEEVLPWREHRPALHA